MNEMSWRLAREALIARIRMAKELVQEEVERMEKEREYEKMLDDAREEQQRKRME